MKLDQLYGTQIIHWQPARYVLEPLTWRQRLLRARDVATFHVVQALLLTIMVLCARIALR